MPQNNSERNFSKGSLQISIGSTAGIGACITKVTTLKRQH